MAEERILDDDIDKNKKYKIRKNADGEDELYSDGDEDEETYGASFYEVPEFTEDDEEAAILTPEQLAAREDERRRQEELKRRFVEESLKKAEELYEKGDFKGALAELESAENSDGKCGEVFALKIKALTCGFQDFSRADDCAECSEGIRRYCTPEQKAGLNSLSARLQRRVETLEENAAALHVEVESKKAERRAVFSKDRAKSVKWFTFTVVPFIVCLILAISFGSVMFAKQDGTNLILTIVFAALAVCFFLATLVTARKMWTAMQKYSLNEKNSSTRIGREYEELCSEVKKLNAVLSAFKEKE